MMDALHDPDAPTGIINNRTHGRRWTGTSVSSASGRACRAIEGELKSFLELALPGGYAATV